MKKSEDKKKEDRKIEEKKKGFTSKPSDRLNVKAADPFKPKNKSKT
jgi:hypothetical protein